MGTKVKRVLQGIRKKEMDLGNDGKRDEGEIIVCMYGIVYCTFTRTTKHSAFEAVHFSLVSFHHPRSVMLYNLMMCLSSGPETDSTAPIAGRFMAHGNKPCC